MKKTVFFGRRGHARSQFPVSLAQAKPSPYEGVSTPPSSDRSPPPSKHPRLLRRSLPLRRARSGCNSACAGTGSSCQSNPDAGIIETPLCSSEDYAPHRAAP